MAGPAIKTPQIFGSGLAATGKVAVFGSKAGGSPAYSTDPEVIQSAQWLQGLLNSLTTGQAPYYQDDNGFRLVVTYILQYLQARGIAEWNSNTVSAGVSKTTYNTGDVCRRGPGGSNITLWQCQADGITSDPLVDGTNWKVWIGIQVAQNLCKAFVNFDGTNVTSGNCLVLAGFNVGTVAKISTGHYRVNFTNALPVDGSSNGLYVSTGSAGTQNGATGIAGDNNTIAFGQLGMVAVRTGSQCDIFCWEPNNGGSGVLEDSACISVQFFG
jgi:hypothetical protein